MKNLINFLQGIVLEKEVILSSNIALLLKKIDDPIAKKLLELQGKGDIDNSYIDLDEESGMVSYLSSNREKLLSDEEKWTVGRQKIKIGRLVKAVFKKENIDISEHQLEQFVSKYLALQTEDKSYFKIVKGNNIAKWYLEDNYFGDNKDSYSLGNSCMRYEFCQRFFQVYTKSENVSLLVLLDKETDKEVGRALLWDNCIGTNNNVKFTFMDRIYCYKTYMEDLFINYAESKGYWYKSFQGNDPLTPLRNNRSNRFMFFKVEIVNIDPNADLPYLDTLKFYCPDEDILTNDENYPGVTQVWDSVDGFSTPIDIYLNRFEDIEDDDYNEESPIEEKLKYIKKFNDNIK